VNLLLTKLILTPLAIVAALWVARRWGDAFGGWLAGLPLTSAPVAAFLAIEHGRAFAAAASAGSVAAVASQASFCRFERRGVIGTFHRPHPAKEAKRYQVKDAREYLIKIGVKP